MSSVRLDGVRFVAWPNDHAPRHVHGYYGQAVAVVELLEGSDVALSRRKYAISPPNAKKNEVKKILDTAAKHADELIQLWESIHGKHARNFRR